MPFHNTVNFGTAFRPSNLIINRQMHSTSVAMAPAIVRESPTPQSQFQRFESPRPHAKQPPLVPLTYSHGSKQLFAMQEYVGKIGWAMQNRQLAQSPQRVILESGMPHKISFDKGHTSAFTKGSGYFSHHVDTRYGIDLDAFQSLDMRTMRQLVKQRVWNQQRHLKNMYLNNSKTIQQESSKEREQNSSTIQAQANSVLSGNKRRNSQNKLRDPFSQTPLTNGSNTIDGNTNDETGSSPMNHTDTAFDSKFTGGFSVSNRLPEG